MGNNDDKYSDTMMGDGLVVLVPELTTITAATVIRYRIHPGLKQKDPRPDIQRRNFRQYSIKTDEDHQWGEKVKSQQGQRKHAQLQIKRRGNC